MQLALGLIETKGLVGAIEAADAMLKAANVKLIKKEKITAALITIEIEGEVAAVKSAVDAGAAAAQRVGQLISTHIIPRPDSQIDKILKSANKSDTHSKRKTLKVEEPEITEESKKIVQEIAEPEDISDEKEDTIYNTEVEIDSHEVDENSETKIQASQSALEIDKTEETSEPDDVVEETETNFEEESAIVEQNIEEIPEQKEIIEEEQSPEQSEPSKSEIKKKSKLKKNEDKNFSFDFEDDDGEENNLSKHSIEELRKQAILEMETEDSEEPENDEISTEIPEKDELETMNVHQLRHLARSIENFPIKGREISKANRKVLIDYFLELK